MIGDEALAMRANRLYPRLVVACRRVAAGALLLMVSGCEPRPTTVSGRVTLDGRPLAIASNARGTVVFQPANGQGTLATGLIDSVGHFDLATGSSIEVPPGKYQVAVSVVQLLPKAEDTEQGTELITPAKYAAAHESGLEAEVTPGQNQLNFNLVSSDDDGNSESNESFTKTIESGPAQPGADATHNN